MKKITNIILILFSIILTGCSSTEMVSITKIQQMKDVIEISRYNSDFYDMWFGKVRPFSSKFVAKCYEPNKISAIMNAVQKVEIEPNGFLTAIDSYLCFKDKSGNLFGMGLYLEGGKVVSGWDYFDKTGILYDALQNAGLFGLSGAELDENNFEYINTHINELPGKEFEAILIKTTRDPGKTHFKAVIGDVNKAEKIMGQKIVAGKVIDSSWIQRLTSHFIESERLKRLCACDGRVIFLTKHKGYVIKMSSDTDDRMVYGSDYQSRQLWWDFREIGLEKDYKPNDMNEIRKNWKPQNLDEKLKDTKSQQDMNDANAYLKVLFK